MDNIIVENRFADKKGEVMLVKLGGYIDQSNSYSLQKVFDDIFSSDCYKIILDFSEVMYISSAGWGIFVGEIKRFRDRGGDIKLANLGPDIYEVYQMLEFYHIFQDYTSSDIALKAFLGEEQEEGDDAIIPMPDSEEQGETIEPESEDSEQQEYENTGSEPQPDAEIEISDNGKDDEIVIQAASDQTTLIKSFDMDPVLKNLANLPLPEKIKKIVAQKPTLSLWKMKKVLKDDRFGKTKVGVLRLYRTLKELNLETKAKRYRFFRSC